MDSLEVAKQLRKETDELEKEATRNLPKKWEIGMRVRYLKNKEWSWSVGSKATVSKLSDECKNRLAEEYQVFWTVPDNGVGIFWTTPDDVELIDE